MVGVVVAIVVVVIIVVVDVAVVEGAVVGLGYCTIIVIIIHYAVPLIYSYYIINIVGILSHQNNLLLSTDQ